WVPVGDGYHLRPIKAADADLDYPAVMGSQPRLWSIFGPAWGWPPASMTYEQDVEDLARHEAEIAGHQSFNYALLDDAETALLGCVYIDPPEKQGADAEVSWWLVDARAGTDLQRTVDALVPEWIAATCPGQTGSPCPTLKDRRCGFSSRRTGWCCGGSPAPTRTTWSAWTPIPM